MEQIYKTAQNSWDMINIIYSEGKHSINRIIYPDKIYAKENNIHKKHKKHNNDTNNELVIIENAELAKTSKQVKQKYKKKNIPKALREQVWLNKIGPYFNGSCYISWCQNQMTCFNFDCGHNIPESKGGAMNIDNLIPICRNCNLGMSNRYTIQEWIDKYDSPIKKRWYFLYLY